VHPASSGLLRRRRFAQACGADVSKSGASAGRTCRGELDSIASSVRGLVPQNQNNFVADVDGKAEHGPPATVKRSR